MLQIPIKKGQQQRIRNATHYVRKSIFTVLEVNRMRVIQHPPHAPSLLESMRPIGYSLESALADLSDNSISAKAKHINIELRPYDAPCIVVIDDGNGMFKDALEKAMRHASTNPMQERHLNDMGRYGLGLKTFSLSQCRRMTVYFVDQKPVMSAIAVAEVIPRSWL